MTPAQQMVVQMKNGLARIGAAINHYAETVFGDALFPRELSGNLKNMTRHSFVLSFKIQ